jgi:three-Cys-motif partner protein
VIPSLQKFGDRSWTQDKLERVRKYLVAYSKIMSKRRYPFAYIDGFAGTGYHELEHEDDGAESLFQELEEPEVEAFLDGSARIAVQVEPRFNKYIFIEKSRHKKRALGRCPRRCEAAWTRIASVPWVVARRLAGRYVAHFAPDHDRSLGGGEHQVVAPSSSLVEG